MEFTSQYEPDKKMLAMHQVGWWDLDDWRRYRDDTIRYAQVCPFASRLSIELPIGANPPGWSPDVCKIPVKFKAVEQGSMSDTKWMRIFGLEPHEVHQFVTGLNDILVDMVIQMPSNFIPPSVTTLPECEAEPELEIKPVVQVLPRVSDIERPSRRTVRRRDIAQAVRDFQIKLRARPDQMDDHAVELIQDLIVAAFLETDSSGIVILEAKRKRRAKKAKARAAG